ncbi:hypothetical protein M427DRAFT_137080 [Gonapodya prolifera JEL478]|uniref:Uncharacterized protein n=1 Tax=Gonapodya prolifera (strain JEL478) TaxID=1344416 RepID=A0A139A8Q0_GONPJ|nr:hypothetical protein M427DRAFT_137080 [Gonapodya prolifera JEL478]|eukprot:KXS12763.1 hypothetical protein M427DRAFT_137080 [Gonapodya prolifera JEL478]
METNPQDLGRMIRRMTYLGKARARELAFAIKWPKREKEKIARDAVPDREKTNRWRTVAEAEGWSEDNELAVQGMRDVIRKEKGTHIGYKIAEQVAGLRGWDPNRAVELGRAGSGGRLIPGDDDPGDFGLLGKMFGAACKYEWARMYGQRRTWTRMVLTPNELKALFSGLEEELPSWDMLPRIYSLFLAAGTHNAAEVILERGTTIGEQTLMKEVLGDPDFSGDGGVVPFMVRVAGTQERLFVMCAGIVNREARTKILQHIFYDLGDNDGSLMPFLESIAPTTDKQLDLLRRIEDQPSLVRTVKDVGRALKLRGKRKSAFTPYLQLIKGERTRVQVEQEISLGA